MKHCLDACAMIAYLRGEAGGNVVDGLLKNPDESCYAHRINMIEVFYDFTRKHSEVVARQALQDLAHVGIVERLDINQKFAMRVGQLKARGRISIADCFCIALAQEISGQVVTSDHHEYDPLIPLGIVPIQFIR